MKTVFFVVVLILLSACGGGEGNNSNQGDSRPTEKGNSPGANINPTDTANIDTTVMKAGE
jgi:hypothetical protein